MTDLKVHPRRTWRPSSPAWILVPLCASVVAYYPALPVSLVLTLVALVMTLLTPPGAPYRRRYLWMVGVWTLLQLAGIAVGFSLWSSFSESAR